MRQKAEQLLQELSDYPKYKGIITGDDAQIEIAHQVMIHMYRQGFKSSYHMRYFIAWAITIAPDVIEHFQETQQIVASSKTNEQKFADLFKALKTFYPKKVVPFMADDTELYDLNDDSGAGQQCTAEVVLVPVSLNDFDLDQVFAGCEVDTECGLDIATIDNVVASDELFPPIYDGAPLTLDGLMDCFARKCLTSAPTG